MDTKQLIIYRNLEYQELFEEFAGLLEGAGEQKDAGSRESEMCIRDRYGCGGPHRSDRAAPGEGALSALPPGV